MYRPKCSQQQASDEVRFCSRCGFQLGLVKGLLTDDEGASATGAAVTQKLHRPPSKRDVTLGATLMFLVALLVFFATTPPHPTGRVQLFFLITVWGVLTLLINMISPMTRAVDKLFAEEGASPSKKGSASSHTASRPTPQVSTPAHNSAPPSSQGIPLTASATQRVNTPEMAQPARITEHTTSSLGSKADSRRGN
jgi:hypothetical protein